MVPIPNLSLTGGAGGDAKAGDLKDYFNAQNSGYRAPMVNIATGRSNLSASPTASAGLSVWLIALLVVGGVVLWRVVKKGKA